MFVLLLLLLWFKKQPPPPPPGQHVARPPQHTGVIIMSLSFCCLIGERLLCECEGPEGPFCCPQHNGDSQPLYTRWREKATVLAHGHRESGLSQGTTFFQLFLSVTHSQSWSRSGRGPSGRVAAEILRVCLFCCGTAQCRVSTPAPPGQPGGAGTVMLPQHISDLQSCPCTASK